MKFITLVLCLISLSIYGQDRIFMPIAPSTPSTGWEVRIDMRLSGTSGAATYNTLAGQPHLAVLSISDLTDITGALTGSSISTISTANWQEYTSGNSSANNSVAGITGGTFFTGANASVYQAMHFQQGAVSPARYNVNFPQYLIAGLTPGASYTIMISGSEGTLGFDARNMSYRVAGATSEAEQEQDGGPGGAGGAVLSITTGRTFTLNASGAGEIRVWANTMASGGGGTSDLVCVQAIIIIKN